MTNEIIVSLNKKALYQGFAVTGTMALFSYFLYRISFLSNQFLGYYLTLMVQIFTLLCSALFSLAFFWGFFELNNDEPILKLSDKGIWIRHHGFIAWNEVSYIGLENALGTPVEYLAIRVKDSNELSKQSSFAGKSAILGSKITGYPPITLSNLTMSNEAIVSYARQFIK